VEDAQDTALTNAGMANVKRAVDQDRIGDNLGKKRAYVDQNKYKWIP